MSPCGGHDSCVENPCTTYKKVSSCPKQTQLVRGGARIKPKFLGFDSVSPAFLSASLQPGSATSVSLSTSVCLLSVHTWLSLLGIPSFPFNFFILVYNLRLLVLFFLYLLKKLIWSLLYAWFHSREIWAKESKRREVV